MRQSWETMTSVSAGHIILTPTQLIGSGRPQRGSNPGPPDQESRALPTELPRPPPPYHFLQSLIEIVQSQHSPAKTATFDSCHENKQDYENYHLK